MTDRLAAAVGALPDPWQGRYFESAHSTQDEARAAAREGAPSRSIFVANYQRAGRGRQGRSWLAAPGTALLVSLLFREPAPASPTPLRWTSLASVAMLEAIEQLGPNAEPAIKWPNDVMLGDRKVAGILAEASWNGRELQVIVGIGVNVSSGAADLADLPFATSLRLACGRDLERGELLCSLLERTDEWLAQPWESLHARWQARLWGRGQRVRLLDLGHEEHVVVLGAQRDGSLRVRLADGTERLTTTGELLR